MIETVETRGAAIERLLRAAFWTAGALLLIAPVIAMQLTPDVRWGGADFVMAGLLIGAVGFVFEAALRLTRSWTYRFAAGLGVAAAFLIMWANGAVGMIGDEGNPYNLYFLGVIALALAGAVLARFRPAGMAFAMTVAGAAQVAFAFGGLAADARGAVFSAGFAALWLLSAALFRKAARDQVVA